MGGNVIQGNPFFFGFEKTKVSTSQETKNHRQKKMISEQIKAKHAQYILRI